MPRKPNYDFEKRRKELDRQAKKAAKLAEREQRREDRRAEETPGQDDGAPPAPADPGV